MTAPEQPTPPVDGSDDLTDTDGAVQPTGNALQPDDPDEQPSQDPDELPAGTETGGA